MRDGTNEISKRAADRYPVIQATAYVWLEPSTSEGDTPYRWELRSVGLESESGRACSLARAIMVALELARFERGLPLESVDVRISAPCRMTTSEFRMGRLAALRAETKAQLQADNGIEVCEICSRPINTEREEGWSDSDGIAFHTACWSGDDKDGLEPDDDDLDLMRLEGAADAPEQIGTFWQLEVSTALGELAVQVERLRRTPCPTMGFGHSMEDVRAAVDRELAEFDRATSDDEQIDESGDVLGTALNLAFTTGRLLEVIRRETMKLRGRLDHIDAGGTWAAAKKAERTTCDH